MDHNYTSDKSTLILLSLLKAHHIRYVIASPGTTNMALVGSMQHDPYFVMYSAADERSAAYMACGLASESGEPVVITCTEATASRNYFPGLTEAYYRKLPILVITGYHGEEKIGHLFSQTIDRSSYPKDVLKMSVSVKKCRNANDEWINIVNINKAILALDHRGKGPVHINMMASLNTGFNQKELPQVRKISRYTYINDLPSLPKGRVAIFIGAHSSFNNEQTAIIDEFCSLYDAVVFCDNTSGYRGTYRVNHFLVAGQQQFESELLKMDLLIHLGEVSGATYITNRLSPRSVWRVSPDGEIRDTFKKLTCVFEMEETYFFSKFCVSGGASCKDYYDACLKEYDSVFSKIPTLPFSNIWIAQQMYSSIPSDSVVYFGIFHSLRSWNFFYLPTDVESYCNVGGFGIDGAISTTLGSALSAIDRLHFLIVGDLAFFYDLNSLGNRHFPNNIRILLVNNGRGIEFRKKDHPARILGNETDMFIAAAGHYGNQSPNLVKHIAEDLGFLYLTASDKSDFLSVKDVFLDISNSKPIIFEVFIKPEDEIASSDIIRNIASDMWPSLKKNVKSIGKEIKNKILK